MTCPRNTEQEILIPAFFAVESISVPPSVSHCLGRCVISFDHVRTRLIKYTNRNSCSVLETDVLNYSAQVVFRIIFGVDFRSYAD